MLTWVSFPDGSRIAADFNGMLRPGTLVIIDGVEYVIEDLGQVATEERPRSHRYGKPRQFVPIVYVKARVRSERQEAPATPIDARSSVPENAALFGQPDERPAARDPLPLESPRRTARPRRHHRWPGVSRRSSSRTPTR